MARADHRLRFTLNLSPLRLGVVLSRRWPAWLFSAPVPAPAAPPPEAAAPAVPPSMPTTPGVAMAENIKRVVERAKRAGMTAEDTFTLFGEE